MVQEANQQLKFVGKAPGHHHYSAFTVLNAYHLGDCQKSVTSNKASLSKLLCILTKFWMAYYIQLTICPEEEMASVTNLP
jgi:hypothetical protein